MNSIKRSCALLLAIVLALGVALQPGIGSVFAENMEQTEQVTEPAAEPEVKAGTDGELPALSFYEQLMACGSLAGLDALIRAEENTAALDALTQDELKQLLERVEEIYAAIEQPTEADALLKEALLKELKEHIIVICPECAGEGGVHNEGCSVLAPVCTCGGEGSAHTEECPLYVPAVTVCPECGEADGHGGTCSQYAAEPVRFPWTELTDPELAAWLMDPANADTVKAILSGGGEEQEALNSRIEAVLRGEDAELAQQVQESLSALLCLDGPETLAADDYIYFDLAAGDITIGGATYSGWIYVGGVKTEVFGKHEDTNKYYIYQSNPSAAEDSPTHPNNTGYETAVDYEQKQNCRIPVYLRVKNGGTPWTDYVTNNTDVKAVSICWDTAAAGSGRTGTQHKITFKSESSYTANVTIDNIWTTYHAGKNKRIDGGIGANLMNRNINCTDTHIRLWLKGDNRVGCVHYSAKEDAGNTIEFYNGEPDGTPGSITVADFEKDFKGNYWSSAIGAADDPPGLGDFADGIVINSGVIYAGTTSADDSTAIGGGGNNFGGVTINGGTVTAVTASTGTAIGGGIGYGSQGGNANVLISGGTVYAYNLGIGTDSGSYKSFVPAAAIGGGSANTNDGNQSTTVTIKGGYVYAQSVGGAAIGGGGSATMKGGGATVTIEGGTVIAKSIGKTVTYSKNGTTCTEAVSAGVSIGGGTGATGGGSVTLTISGEHTILRTGSIGGGKTTGTGNIGSANVKILGGDITGQVIMAEGAAQNCSFIMTGGRIHDTNVVEGNTVTDAGWPDPQPGVEIQYLQKNGGAVWMQDKNGVTSISGGTIENCTAERGGAVYMEGGAFTLSGTGTIQGNTASGTYDQATGRGGGIYITGGNANIQDGSINGNTAHVRGGGIYVSDGNVTMAGGSIRENKATGNGSPSIGRGGGVYLEGGLFTMNGGKISGNSANYRGGGIFLTQSPILTKGTISGNSAKDSGGGLCINGDKLELTSADMEIFGNEAAKGGGVAVLNGEFILRGGAVGLDGAVGDNRNRAAKGGGVYVANDANTGAGAAAHASVTVYSGSIWYNYAEEGGGVYLDKGEGTFTLDGEQASVIQNKAKNGGGIYLFRNPDLLQGTIGQNTATENGGGMYISDCRVILNPTGAMTITGNQAQNGAGIYIHDSNPSSTGGSETPGSSIDAVSSATPTPNVGLRVGKEGVDFPGILIFTNNIAGQSGGAVCVDAGQFNLESGSITMTGNQAENGGGVAVLKGNFTMLTGSIGEKNGANHATNGGGVYVSGGEIWLKGGSVQYNTATDGGGAYVTGGRIVMMDGSLANNEAERNGGGAYAAGNFRMLGGTVGGAGGGNRAANGGGVYVNEGNVYIVYGEISHNYASQDGGGFHISSVGKAVEVEMLSGSLSDNEAGGNGGGMAVESANQKGITVKIGCLLNHYDPSGSGGIKLPINYTEAYTGYAEFDGKQYRHEACPVVAHNNAGLIGGGFYMNSDASTLSFYCVEETENTAQGTGSAGMEVVGGRVIIGDEDYHNYKHGATLIPPQEVPRGYVSMDDATLVNGGQVDIYGDMTNPVFKNEVTVDIQDTKNDHFIDHRLSKDGKRYKVHYFENFQDKGLYEAFQYNEGHTEITIEGALYSHPGYEILGWCTQPVRNDGEAHNHYYEVGTKIDLADGPDKVPGLGIHPTKCPICGDKNDETLLVLYAIWEANGYTVVFDPNVPVGGTYSGAMSDQIYQYDQTQALTSNAYQYPGHFFKGWNTKADGTGTAYTDGQEVQNLTTQNGGKVVLYAQWDPCDHKDSHRWSYEVSADGKTLLRICSCGGQTLTATLYAEDTVYDGHSHPATLTLDDQEA